MATLNLVAPVEGAQNVIVINEGVTSLDLGFDSSSALFERVEGDLIISFEDNSSIRLENFYGVYNADFMPEFVLDGFAIAGEDFFTAFDANLMPAASGAGGTGAVADKGADLQSLESDSNTNPDNTQEGTEGIDGTAGSAATFLTNGLGSDLGYMTDQANILADSGSSSTPPAVTPTPPTTGEGSDGGDGGDTTPPVTPPTDGGEDGNTTPPVTPPTGGGDDGNTAPPVTPPTEGGDGGTPPTPPTPPTPQNYELSVSEAHGNTSYSATGNVVEESTETQVVDLGDKYASDITVSASGEVTITGELADYINSLTIDQKLTLQLEDTAGNSYTINVSGTNANDDNLIIGSFSGGTFIGTNQDKEHINTEDTSDLDIDSSYSGHEFKLDLGAGNDTLVATGTVSGNIYGADGNDNIDINSVANGRVYGDAGNDTINVDKFNGGTISGGADDDTLTVDSMSAGILDGGAGNDNITVKDFNQGDIRGGSGNDKIQVNELTNSAAKIHAGEGNDTVTVTGNMNNGTILGEAGEDTININGMMFGGTIDGGNDNDTINAGFVFGGTGSVTSTILGGSGRDTINIKHLGGGKVDGGDGMDTINITTLQGGSVSGGKGFDIIEVGTMNGGMIYGGDEFDGGSGENIGTGDMIKVGTMSNAEIFGEAGDDGITVTTMKSGLIDGGIGKDTVGIGTMGQTGAPNNDTIVNLGEGDDTFHLTGEMISGTVNAGSGNDVINVNEVISGVINAGEGNDSITIEVVNGNSSTTIDAGEGDDTVIINELSANSDGLSSDIEIMGGEGFDIIQVDSVNVDGTINFDTTISIAENGDISIDGVTFPSISGFEGVSGGLGDDTMIGNSGDNTLFGGEGSDLLTGGAGDDTFGYQLSDFTDGANDTITDFGNGSDILDLTAFKSSGFDITFSAEGSHGIITITGDSGSQTITLQDIGADIASEIENQIESGSFDGGIKL